VPENGYFPRTYLRVLAAARNRLDVVPIAMGLERAADANVVAEAGAVLQVHLFGLEIDSVDLSRPIGDTAVQLVAPRAGDLVKLCQAERDEEQAWLVDVAMVLVDHHGLELVRWLGAPQVVGYDRASGAATGNDYFPGHRHLRPATSRFVRALSR